MFAGEPPSSPEATTHPCMHAPRPRATGSRDTKVLFLHFSEIKWLSLPGTRHICTSWATPRPLMSDWPQVPHVHLCQPGIHAPERHAQSCTEDILIFQRMRVAGQEALVCLTLSLRPEASETAMTVTSTSMSCRPAALQSSRHTDTRACTHSSSCSRYRSWKRPRDGQ